MKSPVEGKGIQCHRRLTFTFGRLENLLFSYEFKYWAPMVSWFLETWKYLILTFSHPDRVAKPHNLQPSSPCLHFLLPWLLLMIIYLSAVFVMYACRTKINMQSHCFFFTNTRKTRPAWRSSKQDVWIRKQGKQIAVSGHACSVKVAGY